jgi:hypothetical protein
MQIELGGWRKMMQASLLSLVLTSVALAAAAQAPRAVTRPAAADAFKPTHWSLTEAGPTVSLPKLELSASQEGPEELVVYGKRILQEDHPAESADVLALGPATLTGTTQAGLPGFRGMTVTATVPVPGVAGLDALLNVSGGHDAINSSTTSASAAVVAGLKMKW